MTLPSTDTIYNSLWLAAGSAVLGAVLCLLWLECGPAKYNGLWLPLIIPALPLADGQYQLALYGWLDGQLTTVLWGHLLWVVPWMLFILRPAWRHRDPRQELIARTLGWRQGRIFLWITCPLLIRPLLAALAVGSVAWWWYTDHTSTGDLRPYLFVQFMPLVLVPLVC